MKEQKQDPTQGLTDLDDFVRIGLALSQERDLANLLEMILSAARSMTGADAGTLYILDPENQCLHFQILQNDTTKTRINAARGENVQIPPPVPLYVNGAPNKANVSSHVALECHSVNIPDVYSAQGFNFSGVKAYDETSGYRSRSMLVIPLADHRQQVLGVLQLLNAKARGGEGVGQFSQHHEALVSALASQASVALTNHDLIEQLEAELAEIKRLRDSERDLGMELRRSVVATEASNAELRTALQAVRTVRIAGVVFLLLMVGIGIGVQQQSGFELFPNLAQMVSKPLESAQTASEAANIQTVTPEIKPVTANITLVGQIEPAKQVNIVAPFSGKIREVFCEYGQAVQEGERLLVIDDSDLLIALRDARAALIRAEQAYKSVQNWASSPDVIRARLNQERAKTQLEISRRKLEETRLMVQKGIIPRAELDSLQEAFDSQLLAIRTGNDDINTLLERGSRDNLSVVEMEWKNAQARVDELEHQRSLGEVKATVAGVVLRPTQSEDERRRAKLMEPGVQFNQGEPLGVIGNIDSISIRTQVDEVNIHKVAMGQDVTVTGDAFPNTVLEGYISYVSCQAQGNSSGRSEGGKPPSFDIIVTCDKLTPEQLKMLRVGMSATLTVTTYRNPEALVLPVTAVLSEMETQSVLLRDPATGKFKRVPIEAGTTTIDSVEVLSGISASDAVALFAENLAP